jgi:hypothetical protein
MSPVSLRRYPKIFHAHVHGPGTHDVDSRFVCRAVEILDFGLPLEHLDCPEFAHAVHRMSDGELGESSIPRNSGRHRLTVGKRDD